MALVGTPNHRGTTLQLVGVVGVNDNDVVLELDNVDRFNEFSIISTLGVFDVAISLDGTLYVPVTMTNQSIVATVEVLVSVASNVMKLTLSSIKGIRVSQNGATAVTSPVMICGQAGRTR